MEKQSSTPPAKTKRNDSDGGGVKKASMIGHDPLAWMKDESDESAEGKMASTASQSERPEPEGGDERDIDQNEDREESPPPASASQTKDNSDNAGTSPDASSALVLERSLGVAVVSKLYEEMKPLLEQISDVEIDASAVDTVDACGLQLLLGFVSSAKEQNIKVHWKQASAKFVEAAEQMDMKMHLGL